MKKILIPLAIFFAALSLSSCEDFLTKTPETKLSPGSYFSSAAELDLWANKFYNDLMPGAADLAELNADDQVSASSLSAIQRGTRTPTSTPWSNDMWKALRRVNYMLENNKCPDEATKNMYDGVCYFFRAWFYYYRVRVFGDIPWYDHVVGSADSLDLKKPLLAWSRKRSYIIRNNCYICGKFLTFTTNMQKRKKIHLRCCEGWRQAAIDQAMEGLSR